MTAPASLDVVALVSGGKDSFFSLLHCLAQGHRVVALANLYPPSSTPTSARLLPVGNSSGAQHRPSSGSDSLSTVNPDTPPESDLNSFMYQTVGHQTIPLYAQATGLPLFRQPIHGSAVHHGINYSPDGHHRQTNGTGDDQDGHDETESLVPLLRAVMKACPTVNAVSTGAILSTYQRTRVESVAIRLGLVPLGYLWQYPDLPRSLPSSPAAVGRNMVDDAQLLRDMAHTGLEARIIKVASAGLDEGTLWENVASETGIARIQRGLRKFGGGGKGAVLGEGGEFETLVVDGPPQLFKGRIIVREDDRQVVREGGGSEWLLIRRAEVEMKTESTADVMSADLRSLPIPALLDDKFEAVLEIAGRQSVPGILNEEATQTASSVGLPAGTYVVCENRNIRMSFTGNTGNVQDQTEQIVHDVRSFLAEQSLEATDILNSVIVLRNMSDFPAVNKLYGSLFTEANPPSRVTISCGEQLPTGWQIAVYLVLQSSAQRERRKGLHVQSRSYWAPANIGPYSQAISYPLIPSSPTSSRPAAHQDSMPSSSNECPPLLTAVSIAGQIPLVPATMEFPPPTATTPTGAPDVTQITLALQHLWRVGVATNVAWWTSAVAYFPASSAAENSNPMFKNSIAAAAAWREAHIWSPARQTAAEDDGTGPDLWDKRYNAQYQSFSAGGDDSADQPAGLPKWNVVDGFTADEDEDADDDMYANDEDERECALSQRRQVQRARRSQYVPYVFAAEVEQLPRSAGVEWHAHIGLGDTAGSLPAGSVRVFSSVSSVPLNAGTDGGEGECVVELHHVAVTTTTTSSTTTGDADGESSKAKKATYLHTTAVLRRRPDQPPTASKGSSASGVVGEKIPVANAVQCVQRVYSSAVASLLARMMTTTATTQTMQKSDVSGTDEQESGGGNTPGKPYLVYTDATAIADPFGSGSAAVIPCHSLFDGSGRRLAAVVLLESFLVES